jgi:YesN/AraC family two-component response regulator
MNDLFDHLFSTDDFWENYSCCYKILGLLLQSSESSQNKINPGIQNSVEYIMKNYTQTISIIDLAKIANMSESNFFAVFKKSFGCSPISYLNHYRISLAADLLTETNSTISEIGYKVGISDPLYFSKLFKKAHGISPREYRTLHLTKHC